MFEIKKEQNSINLLYPINSSRSFFSHAYEWLVTVGKYLLIATEVFVLVVFFMRFKYDRERNDLTEKINKDVAILKNDSWKNKNFLYINYQNLLSDVSTISKNQDINSEKILLVLNEIPQSFTLHRFSFSYRNNKYYLTYTITTTDTTTLDKYESIIKGSPNTYSDVSVSEENQDNEWTATFSYSLVDSESIY